MPPTLQLPQRAARLWTDPAVRARIVAMHRDDIPLIDMCEELGLMDAVVADGLQAVIEGLDSEEVSVIRDAFVAEARFATGSGAHFPVDCRIDSTEGGVQVVPDAPGPGAVGPIARIEPA